MPFDLLVGVQRLGQPKIDVGRHTRDARAGRMGVGGYDQVRKLVEQRELGPREKFGGALKDGCCGRSRRRPEMEQRSGERRRGHLEHLAAREPLLRIDAVVAHRFPFLNSSARYSQERHASAMMVHVGFWHDALTWLEPSTTNRLRTSCDCWNWLRTEVLGSLPIRAVPSSWMDHPSVRISRSCPTTSIPAP